MIAADIGHPGVDSVAVVAAVDALVVVVLVVDGCYGATDGAPS